jgi:hypothetical protein
VLARHGGEALRAFQPHGDVPQPGKRLEIPARPAAEVQDRERRLALEVAQKFLEVLADVVLLRPAPEILRALVVVLQRDAGNLLQVLPMQRHLSST